MKRKIFNILFAILCVMSVCSCEHELCETHPHHAFVDVRFHWNRSPRAESSVMAVCFFPTNGGPYIRYDFINPEGGRIKIPTGSYHAVCFNSDRANVFCSPESTAHTAFNLFSNRTGVANSLAQAGVRADDTPPRPEGTLDEWVCESPMTVYGDTVYSRGFHEKLGVYTVDFSPRQFFKKYTIHVKEAVNIKYIRAISGMLTSLSDSYYPFAGRSSSDRVSIPFPMTFSTEANTIDGELLAFGHPDDSGVWLAVYIVLGDGSKWYSHIDVTDQVRKAGDADLVPIEIDKLTVPKPIVNGGGLHPSVDDWTTIYVPLKM